MSEPRRKLSILVSKKPASMEPESNPSVADWEHDQQRKMQDHIMRQVEQDEG